MERVRHLGHFVRQLRMLSLLGTIPMFRHVEMSLARIFPVVTRLLLLLFSFLYIFAVLGCQLFAEHMVGSNPALRHEDWLPFADALNFQDIYRSLITLFECMMVTRWPTVMEAASKATSFYEGRAFFFTFFVIYVMVRATACVVLPLCRLITFDCVTSFDVTDCFAHLCWFPARVFCCTV
jgi:hypothetical protein